MLEKWLKNNYQGSMEWMERWKEKRMDIKEFFPGAKSVICVAHNYFSPEEHSKDPKIGKISRYAWGVDYHKIMKKKLKQLLQEIFLLDSEINARLSVDTAPIMEKLWAEKAGIGWQGKHTNLITRDLGSWVFLGEVVIDRVLEYDQSLEDCCGTCQACIEACPTDAIVAPYILDARKCISYLTIENGQESLPEELTGKQDNWIFGCDICQDVCPWNKFQQSTAETRYQPREENINPDLKYLASLDEETYKKKFKDSPVLRAKWKNFIRNVKAAENSYSKNEIY